MTDEKLEDADGPPPLPGADKGRHDVILTGGVGDGFDRHAVIAVLAALFKITPDRAAALIANRETIVKRSVPIEDARRYLAALSKAGAVARIEPSITAPSPYQIADLQHSPRPHAAERSPQPSMAELSLLPIEKNSEGAGAGNPEAESDAVGNSQRSGLGSTPLTGNVRSPINSNSQKGEPNEPIETDTPAFFSFSLHGRIRRLRSLAYQALAIGSLIFPAVPAGLFVKPPPGPSVALVLFLAPFVLFFTWQWIRSQVLRLHDINLSGKWVLAPFFLSFVIILFQGDAGQKTSSLLWVLLDLFTISWPGSNGENRFGLPSGPNSMLIKIAGGAMIPLLLVGLFVSPKHLETFGQNNNAPTVLRRNEVPLADNAFALKVPGNVHFQCVRLPHAQSCTDHGGAAGSPVQICRADSGFASYVTIVAKHPAGITGGSQDPNSDFEWAWSHCPQTDGMPGYYTERAATRYLISNGVAGEDFSLATGYSEDSDSMARVFVTKDYSVMALAMRNPSLNNLVLVNERREAAVEMTKVVTSLHPLTRSITNANDGETEGTMYTCKGLDDGLMVSSPGPCPPSTITVKREKAMISKNGVMTPIDDFPGGAYNTTPNAGNSGASNSARQGVNGTPLETPPSPPGSSSSSASGQATLRDAEQMDAFFLVAGTLGGLIAKHLFNRSFWRWFIVIVATLFMLDVLGITHFYRGFS